MSETILIIGACGQIGAELTIKLREKFGAGNVIASDIKEGSKELMESGHFEILDATDKQEIIKIIKKYRCNQVYLMAAMLSAVAEKYPEKAWDLNMNSLLHVLNLAKDKIIDKVYWPSSIAVFGSTTPKIHTPQITVTEPSTVYGISKLAGERWCAYYKEKFNVDVRSIRYPGIISWKAVPGGGTTDYAIAIFSDAVKTNEYTCFLKNDTRLPMMYMDDAIKATIDLMEATNLKTYQAYNISAMDFTPAELTTEIQKTLPNFKIHYQPDFRQEIADSWPKNIDDSMAREDWKWNHKFDLETITKTMIKNISNKFNNVLEETM